MKTAIEKFEQKNMAAFEALVFVANQRKQLDEQEKDIKKRLLEGMKKHGIDSIDNDIVRINYVPKSEGVSIDLKKFKAEDPSTYRAVELAYNKRTKRSEHIRITVK